MATSHPEVHSTTHQPCNPWTQVRPDKLWLLDTATAVQLSSSLQLWRWRLQTGQHDNFWQEHALRRQTPALNLSHGHLQETHNEAWFAMRTMPPAMSWATPFKAGAAQAWPQDH